MAYVAPNSIVEYFGSVIRWAPAGDDRPYFGNTSAKDTAFGALSKIATETQVAYIDRDWTSFRSALPISTLINARYMRFKNTAFENKWFYAFITSVDYANNGLTLVTFALDTWVTWDGDFALTPSYIVRQHASVDSMFNYLLDEGLSYGDYVNPEMEQITDYHPYFVLGASVDAQPDGQGGYIISDSVPAQLYKGYMLAGTKYYDFDLTSTVDLAALSAMLTAIVKANKQDAIISMRIVPDFCVPKTGTGPALPADYGGTFTSAFTYSGFAFDGYTPHNNKLYTYPYQCYCVINGEGSENEYRVEFFANGVPSFLYEGVSFDNCEVILAPRGYRKLSVQNYEEAMIMRQFPQGSMGIDQYKAYVAQMSSGGGWIATAGKVLGGLVGIGGAVISGNADAAVNSALGLVNTAFKLLQDNVYYDSIPNAVKGGSNNNIMSAIAQKKFFGIHKRITGEYARAIDHYFDLYGYKMCYVETSPALHYRPHWTFTQMMDAKVTGAIPASAAREIEAMLNVGIRCWRVLSEIGNYALDNRPAP